METIAFARAGDGFLVVAVFLGFVALILIGIWAMRRGTFEAPDTVDAPPGCFFPIAILILLFCASTQYRRAFVVEAGPTALTARYLPPRFSRTVAYSDLAEVRVIRRASEPPRFWLELRAKGGGRLVTESTESRVDALRAAAVLRARGAPLAWIQREGKEHAWKERVASEAEVSAP